MATKNLGIKISADLTKAKIAVAQFKKSVQNTSLEFNSKGVGKTTSSLKTMGKEVDSVGKKILDASTKMATWMALGAGISVLIGGIREMGTAVVDLDKDLTLMSFTTNFSNKQFEQMIDLQEEMGSVIGGTLSDIREASKIYTNLNETMESIISNSEASVVLSNLGGSAISITDATNALQALQSQFELTNGEAMNIVDTLTFVSANLRFDFADGIKEISAGISISGALAREAGLEYETFIAILGKTIESTRRSGSAISSGIKTIISRLTRVKDLGADELSDIQGAYRNIGIEVLKDADTFKDFGLILEELSGKWDTLSDVERKYIAFLSAGTRQQATFISVVDNYAEAQELATEALNNQGFALKNNEKFIESLQGRFNLFKNALQEFSRDLLSSDLFKGFVDGGREFIRILMDAEKAVGLLNIALLLMLPKLALIVAPAFISALVGIGALLKILAISFLEIGASATLASVGVSVLGASIAVATAGIALLIGLLVLQEKAERKKNEAVKESIATLDAYNKTSKNISELIRQLKNAEEGTAEFYEITRQLNELLPEAKASIDEQTDSLEKQADVYIKLNELAKEKALRDAKRALSEIESLTSLREKQTEYTNELKDQEAIQDSYLKKKLKMNSEGKEISEHDALVLKNAGKEIDKYTTKLENVNTEIEVWKSAMDIMSEAQWGPEGFTNDEDIQQIKAMKSGLYDLADATDETVESMEDFQTATDAVKESTDLLIDSINKSNEDYEYFSDKRKLESKEYIKFEIDKTEGLIKASALRLETMKSEHEYYLKTQNDKFRLEGAFDQASLLDKIYAESEGIEDYTVRLNKLRKELSGLVKADEGTSGKGKTKELTETEKRIKLLETELKILEIQEDLANDLASKNTLRDKQILKIMELKETVKEGSQEWYEYSAQIKNVTSEISDSLIELDKLNKTLKQDSLEREAESIQNYKDGIDEVKKVIRKMLENELKGEIEANEHLVDLAKENLDAILKQMDAERNLQNFQDSREKKEENLVKIDSKMASLRVSANQGDMKAKIELIKLEEDRADIQESLDKEINDRSFNLRKENLNKQYDEYKDAKNSENEVLRDKLKDAEELTKMTNDVINENLKEGTDTLYGNLVNWNSKYGLDFDSMVISKWEKLLILMKEASGMNDGFSTKSFSDKLNEDAVINQMKTNSSKYLYATESEKINLHEDNKRLGSSIGATYDSGSGIWTKDNKRLYDNGGQFRKGDVALKNTSDTEWILKDVQLAKVVNSAISGFMNTPKPNLTLPKIGGAIGSSQSLNGGIPDVNITIEGSITDGNLKRVTSSIKDIIKGVSQGQVDAFKNAGIRTKNRIR